MLNNYFTEILDRSEWIKKTPIRGENPVRKTVISNIDFKKYKENLKDLKKIFTKLNNGKFKSTLIFDYEKIKTKESQGKLSVHDITLMEVLKKLDYEVSEESYMLGFANKNKKPIMIKDIVNSLKSKKLDSMRAAFEKTGNQAIKKQLDALEDFSEINIEYTIPMTKGKESKYKIVLSIQPMLIASQSTKVGWTSCMNLYDGSLNDRVGKGITDGVIIAYLVKTGDEKTLNSPVARVLIKPLRNEKTNETIYAYDKAYGTPPKGFENKVIEIIKMTGKYVFGKETKPGFYEIDPWSSYIDPDLNEILDKPTDEDKDPAGITIFSKEEKQLLAAINSDDFSADQILKEVMKTSDEFKSYVIVKGDLTQESISKVIKSIKIPPTNLIMSLDGLGLDQKEINNLIENYVTYTKNISAKKLAKMILFYDKNDMSSLTKLKKLEEIGIPVTKELIYELTIELSSEDYYESIKLIEKYKKVFETVADWVKITKATLMGYEGRIDVYDYVPSKFILEVATESLEFVSSFDIFIHTFIRSIIALLSKSDFKKIAEDVIKNKKKSRYYEFAGYDQFLEELSETQKARIKDIVD